MLNVSKPRLVCALVLSVGLLIVAVNVRVMAQSASSASGTILGTVTDSSGGVIPDAKVQVTNTGSAAGPNNETSRFRPSSSSSAISTG